MVRTRRPLFRASRRLRAISRASRNRSGVLPLMVLVNGYPKLPNSSAWLARGLESQPMETFGGAWGRMGTGRRDRDVEGGRRPSAQGIGTAGDGPVEELDQRVVLLLRQGEFCGGEPPRTWATPRTR